MRRTDPVRKGDVARVIRAGTVVGRREVAGYGFDRDRAVRPPGARAPQDPLEHQVRHMRRGDDLVVGPTVGRPDGQELVEKSPPI